MTSQVAEPQGGYIPNAPQKGSIMQHRPVMRAKEITGTDRARSGKAARHCVGREHAP